MGIQILSLLRFPYRPPSWGLQVSVSIYYQIKTAMYISSHHIRWLVFYCLKTEQTKGESDVRERTEKTDPRRTTDAEEHPGRVPLAGLLPLRLRRLPR